MLLAACHAAPGPVTQLYRKHTVLLAETLNSTVETGTEGEADGAEVQAAMATWRSLAALAADVRNEAAARTDSLAEVRQALPGRVVVADVLQRAEALKARLGVDPLPAFQRGMLAAL